MRSRLSKIVASCTVLATAILTVAACETVVTYAPPGVSQAQLDLDANACERRSAYASDHLVAYKFCMHMLGYGVRRPDGTLWEGQQRQAYIRPDYSPPVYVPPPLTETQPEPSEPSTPPANYSVPPATQYNGEMTASQQKVLDFFLEEGTKAGTYCALRAYLRHRAGEAGEGISCAAERMFEGVSGRVSLADLQGAICSNPNALQRLPLVTVNVENWIVQKVGC